MTTLVFFFIFCLGLIIGSFLNVVIYRFNTGKTLGGRSMCMTCSKTLYWYELIPVISFLFQKGRCNGCATKISHQYPLVEFVTGAMFTLVAYHFLPVLDISPKDFVLLLTFFSFIFSILIVISVYDMRHKIIPDNLVYFFIFLSFVSVFMNTTGVGSLMNYDISLWDLLVGPVAAAPFAFIWLISKGRWMGLGDAKLIFGIALILGPLAAPFGIMLAFWIGTLFSVFVLLLSHMKIKWNTEIPFAPFLVLAFFISFLCNLDVFFFDKFF